MKQKIIFLVISYLALSGISSSLNATITDLDLKEIVRLQKEQEANHKVIWIKRIAIGTSIMGALLLLLGIVNALNAERSKKGVSLIKLGLTTMGAGLIVTFTIDGLTGTTSGERSQKNLHLEASLQKIASLYERKKQNLPL